MTSDSIFGLVLFWVAFTTIIGGVIGQSKGRAFAGVVWGFFLNVLGVLIIALMPLTARKQAERDQQQAERFWAASGGAIGPAGAPPVSGQARQELLAEAVRRDPTLGADQSPEVLARLAETLKVLEQEFALRRDLDAIHQVEAGATEARRQVEAQAEEARQRTAVVERELMHAAVRAAARRKWLRNNWIWISAGGVAVVVLLFLSVAQYQKSAAERTRLEASRTATAFESAQFTPFLEDREELGDSGWLQLRLLPATVAPEVWKALERVEGRDSAAGMPFDLEMRVELLGGKKRLDQTIYNQDLEVISVESPTTVGGIGHLFLSIQLDRKLFFDCGEVFCRLRGVNWRISGPHIVTTVFE